VERLTGQGIGLFSSNTMWDSLQGAFAAFESFYADPEVVAAITASPVETVQRIIGIVEATTGEQSGAFAEGPFLSMATPDPDRIAQLAADGQEIASSVGVNGLVLMRMFSAGAVTGTYAVGAYTDDIDTLAAQSTANLASDTIRGHVSAPGVQIANRVIARLH
jgi:hypothetical protein